MPILDSSAFATNDALPGHFRCDVCIVGTGPAGMTIARELSGTSVQVTILESGGTERQEATDALNEIESVGWPRVMDQWLVRNRIVGGSSHTWTGRCAPFDEIDLQFRDWIPYSGWPFQIHDLMPYVCRSANYLGIGNEFTEDRFWAISGCPQPKRVSDPDKLLPMVWQFSRDSMHKFGTVSFGRLTAGLGSNVTLITNATVLRVNVTDSATAIKSVEFAGAGGRRWSLPTPTVVLCAGGIENARLLLSSDNVVAQGLGNDHDLVGRFLMDHPRGTVARFPLDKAQPVLSHFAMFKSRATGGLYQHGMRLSPAVQRSERLLNCAAWIDEGIAPDDPWDSLIRLLRRDPNARLDFRVMLANSPMLAYGLKEHFISHRALPRKLDQVTLEAMCEQLPNRDSRITLSERRDRLGMRISRIDWRVSEEEARAMRRTTELMVQQLSRTGIEPPVLEEWVHDGAMFPETIQDIAHPMGTTRMADDPAQGVVDADCQVHGVQGLFIGGSSVFPTAGQSNPTQMIVALALRLADTLKDRATGHYSGWHKPGVEPVRSNAQSRVLVTGATGMIGGHVIDELLTRGYRVRALSSRRVIEAPASDRLEWCQLDFQKSLDFDPVVRDCAAVIHLAAELDVIERMRRSNVEATRALAQASERAGIEFFCYTSSVSVYGSSRRRRVLENSPVLTTDRDVQNEYWGNEALRSYGRTKLQAEHAIDAVANNVEYVVLRPTVVVDVQQLAELGGWSKLKKQRVGSRDAHHIYVRDVVDAILWFMERSLRRDKPLPGVSTFNLADDDTPFNTYGRIFEAAYETTGDPRWRVTTTMPWPVEWLLLMIRFHRVLFRQPFGRMRFAVDKLRQAGYTPRFGMSRAVAVFCEELASSDTSAVPENRINEVSA